MERLFDAFREFTVTWRGGGGGYRQLEKWTARTLIRPPADSQGNQKILLRTRAFPFTIAPAYLKGEKEKDMTLLSYAELYDLAVGFEFLCLPLAVSLGCFDRLFTLAMSPERQARSAGKTFPATMAAYHAVNRSPAITLPCVSSLINLRRV